MATPEKKVKQKVCAKLKELGAYYFYASTGGYGSSGVPDIIACYKGKFVAIECKANGNIPTGLQQKHLREISIQNGIALVIDETNIDMLEYFIRGKQVFNNEERQS